MSIWSATYTTLYIQSGLIIPCDRVNWLPFEYILHLASFPTPIPLWRCGISQRHLHNWKMTNCLEQLQELIYTWSLIILFKGRLTYKEFTAIGPLITWFRLSRFCQPQPQSATAVSSHSRLFGWQANLDKSRFGLTTTSSWQPILMPQAFLAPPL